MSDLHSINEAINKRAGRKLLPSIVVSLSLIALVWFALAYERVIFAAVVAVAVVLGVRELSKALAQREIYISFRGLALATIGLSYATWVGAVAGLAIATAIAFPVLLISLLRRGPEKFVANANPEVVAAERERYQTLYEEQEAPGLIAALLLSPNFLYRSELGVSSTPWRVRRSCNESSPCRRDRTGVREPRGKFGQPSLEQPAEQLGEVHAPTRKSTHRSGLEGQPRGRPHFLCARQRRGL